MSDRVKRFEKRRRSVSEEVKAIVISYAWREAIKVKAG